MVRLRLGPPGSRRQPASGIQQLRGLNNEGSLTEKVSAPSLAAAPPSRQVIAMERAKGRLERALRAAEFCPDNERVWRWESRANGTRTVVKFELLSDLDDVPAGATVWFDSCDALGAANLRGTRFAARDRVVRDLAADALTL